ncbi:efflux RND transporter permease subunit [Oceanicoccus sp. KOV_DT_Chl]|uniref:efflux RND transporter permease subunit n=1 Tax=Oceanicoccus sp. KOV_DT_Chl TaxID=1904639 RepID=UPI001F17EB55|nr:efflux RND transporter permease subunit [Oceanicoccus sp. KOV_DT_Chl]
MGKSALDLQFDYGKLAAYGLNVKQVSDAIKVAMDGLIIGEQQTAVERMYYRLNMQHEDEPSMSELMDLFIINQRGEPVALRSVAEFVMRPGDADIKHYAGRRTVTVYAEIDRQLTDVSTINNRLSEYVRDYQRTHTIPSVSFFQGGEIEQQQQSMGDITIAFVTCLLLSFMVLVALFNSYSQPLIVLAVLPFGMVGVFMAFAIQGLPLSFLAIVGVLGLVGVLLNNSVVMVHTLNTGKRKIDDEAIVRRAVTRFRPIVITSLTTLVGLVPAAYGLGGEDPLVTPMVMAMVWGVMFGTVVSLLMLPCIFAINQDIRAKLFNTVDDNTTQLPQENS